MTIEYLITMLETALSKLGEQRTSAERNGDVAAITRIDTEMAQTTDTLNQLYSLIGQ